MREALLDDGLFILKGGIFMAFSIAIDGPASAGKSTLAKKIAEKLSFIYVDTGAIYRTIGLFCIKNNIDMNSEEEVSKHCQEAIIDIKYKDGIQQIFLNNENVTSEVRKEEVGRAASITSVYRSVREYLLSMQRHIAENDNVVMDGRDIGTVVLPNAQIKIFLVASVQERAIRRHKELLEKGIPKSLEEVKQDIIDRDIRDSSRELAPLKQARDAILLDTTNMSVDDEIDFVVKLCSEKMQGIDI